MTAASQTSPLILLKRSFGFQANESQHHFLVQIPRGSAQPIHISEHLTWNEHTGSSLMTTSDAADGQIRVVLPHPKWDAIADVVRAEFNRRLRSQGNESGVWRLGHNLVRRDLGKELVLLAWAVEDADPSLIPNALANWQGLFPEERWWLYTQTAAASGHGLHGRNVGWRKAVRFALTENPVSDIQRDGLSLPEFYRRAETLSQPQLLEPQAELDEGTSDDSSSPNQ